MQPNNPDYNLKEIQIGRETLGSSDLTRLRDALAIVRATGAVNMFDRMGASQVCAMAGYDDEAKWLGHRDMRKHYVALLNDMGKDLQARDAC